MSNYKSDFIREIYSRGYIHQSTDLTAIDKKLSKMKMTAYIGFDATSDSLHIGSLIPLMLLSWFQHFENKPIALIGGGTTMVGDPSGKDESRRLMKINEISKNKDSIKKIFKKFITFNDNKALMLDNYQWLSKKNYIDFIRTVGSHLTINRMLNFDSVKSRLSREQPLSFLEFNYMILQSYDFLHLNKNYACEMQMGGSDQWGNIVNGIELVRKINNKTVYGITSPLITTSSGEKMGKTASGAIWLNKEKLKSYDFYQFWRNIDDIDVGKFLKLFTFLDLNEISKLSKLKGSEINEAKKILAFEVTKICRGHNEAKKAESMAKNTFEKGAADERMATFKIKKSSLKNNEISIVDAMIKLNLINSRGEAKRLIKGGGVKINNATIKDINLIVNETYFKNKDVARIACGKKRFGLIKVIN
ncbi:MAG: Tyrosine--tRNA ligase [Alphaproteobacteria bacterium MarineAlpha5_Bin11]|nr:tyrosine--tRNA ligase [Pelagibacteraceae bacterium]PPR42481.1 MAG: Tyrosine--tRNA ligase [Alphaproteobacteria bacterium MarineAlpha5_Bin11]PPR51580.1 MAG: Tyrosine--tRNA ligase [Alphaproteobacteria bacterium MarineAlpha5_Bin10]|tara:strand:- start:280 stop:1533 length:1254 start_codon:yes stop_codon:yes gene_type:complete